MNLTIEIKEIANGHLVGAKVGPDAGNPFGHTYEPFYCSTSMEVRDRLMFLVDGAEERQRRNDARIAAQIMRLKDGPE
jgi:hypothetical protein